MTYPPPTANGFEEYPTQLAPAQSEVTPQPLPFAPVPVALPAPYAPSAGKPQRRKKGTIATIVVLTLLTLGSLAFAGYMWLSAARWQSNAEAWSEQATTHGESVANLSEELQVTQQQVNSLEQLLESAQARITELANERAQLGDRQVVDQNQIDFQQRLSVAAAQVASSLDLCISRQDELIEALRNPGRYTEESVAQFGQQVGQFCAEAPSANTNLQAEINR